MSRQLSARLAKLEGGKGGGDCPDCAGGMIVHTYKAGEAAELPGDCPECGEAVLCGMLLPDNDRGYHATNPKGRLRDVRN